MIVADASVVVPALVDDGAVGRAARLRLVQEPAAAPEVLDLEVLSALRRHVRARRLAARRAGAAALDLRALPVERVPHAPLLERAWALRHNLTPYDAAYVALAEALEVPLLTADRRLARATGPRCVVELCG